MRVIPRYTFPRQLQAMSAGISVGRRPTKGTSALALASAFCSEMPRMTRLDATVEDVPSVCFSSVAAAASRAACLECAMSDLRTDELSQRRAPYHH